MKAKGIASHIKLRALIAGQVLWVGLICLLGAWWAKLALQQARKIEELEIAAGLATGEAHHHWERTQRMLYWESSTFFIFALITAVFLFWIYWSELARARSIQAFFASLTHELRTPLTSIRLQAESMVDDLPSDSSARKWSKRILEDSQRLETQVERTLELARLEGGGPVLTQPIQLKPWLERFAQAWKDAGSAPLELTIDMGDHAIEADPAALQVVFKNLFENSFKHSGHSGNKTIRVWIEERASDPRHVELSIEDDGRGHSDHKNHGKLGKLFYRGEGSLGSGVGLYLVCALMGKMGGDARFSQSSRGGFSVRLSFVREGREGRAHA